MRFVTLSGALGALTLLSTVSASADELVKNGDFETPIPGVSTSGMYWTKFGQANIADVSGSMGGGPNDYLTGPHGMGNGTGPQVTTRTAWIGGLNPTVGSVSQDIATAGFDAATLTFKLVYEDKDVPGADFFYVRFGTATVMTVDLGAGFLNGGGPHWWVRDDNVTIDLTPYMDGSVRTLTFEVVNDARAFSSSAAWVDNVSIQGQPVPEPATVAALGLGAATLLRRRRKA